MTLEIFRQRGALMLMGMAGILAAATVIIEMARFGAIGVASLLATVLSVILGTSFATFRLAPAGRHVTVAVLMGQVAAMLISMRGHPMQIDIHMTFFAALAMCALLYDVRAILLATGLVAIHHLGLGLLWSDLVFYGGGSIGRIALHAVILLAEAGALIWMTMNTDTVLGLAEDRAQEVAKAAEAEQSNARELARSAQTAAEHAEQLRQLQREFAGIVEAGLAGDFNQRMQSHYQDEHLDALVDKINLFVDQINEGLLTTQAVLRSVAEADLTYRLEGTFRGVFADLQQHTNAVAEMLSDVMGQLKHASSSLKIATGDILSGASDLSKRTVSQAETIKETSHTMDQFAAIVARNAEGAGKAREAALTVTNTAEEGGQVMGQATEAMERITESSDKISNIIKFIDDIAFQTNLLALNASVEAARAGEAGKGFAVVAVEVRRLAQSAAEASSQVKTLIEQSAREIHDGTQLVENAAAKLQIILSAASTSSELMHSIAQDSQEQAASIDQVNTAVRHLDRMTHHNATLVEQINSAIGKTEAQAVELDRIVDIFATEEPPAAIAATPPEGTPQRELKQAV